MTVFVPELFGVCGGVTLRDGGGQGKGHGGTMEPSHVLEMVQIST